MLLNTIFNKKITSGKLINVVMYTLSALNNFNF